MSKAKHFVKILVIIAMGNAFSACGNFTTLQTAKVSYGWHLRAGVGMLTDQTRKGKSQGSDVAGFVSPSFGLGRSIGLELGIPFGWYLEDGLRKRRQPRLFPAYFDYEDGRHFLILPYFKLASSQEKRDIVAGLIDPSSMTVIYSHDFNRWTPYVSVKKMFLSGNPALHDVPRKISRYQEDEQSIWVLAFGGEWKAKFRPALEIGIMRNRHQELILSTIEVVVYDPNTGTYRTHEEITLSPGGDKKLLYDFFLGVKVTF